MGIMYGFGMIFGGRYAAEALLSSFVQYCSI
jgi:hypothetical protein